MRILHTSDWHLGRALCGQRLLDDQAFVLDQLTRIADDFHPDAVLVAGDVYDRAVPAPDAVQLLDDVVTRLVLDRGIHVFLIAGNHDSGTRLSFGARLLARGKLHLIGSLREGPSVVVLPDDYGDVSICTVPYAEPMLAADELDCPSICDHDTAMRAAVERVRAAAPAGRTVLMTHAFVAGGEISESERTLTVGGAGTVAADAFDGFTYVALGHLHRAQALADTVRYSGSILKYSFSEEHHAKSVELVEIDAQGGCRIERVPLVARRDVRTIQGRFDDLMRTPDAIGRNDLIGVELLDSEPILDGKLRLSEIYPNVLQVRQPNFLHTGGTVQGTDTSTMDDATLFASFFQQVMGRALTAEEAAEFASVHDEVSMQEREVTA